VGTIKIEMDDDNDDGNWDTASAFASRFGNQLWEILRQAAGKDLSKLRAEPALSALLGAALVPVLHACSRFIETANEPVDPEEAIDWAVEMLRETATQNLNQDGSFGVTKN
jgi:hypothetical protein